MDAAVERETAAYCKGEVDRIVVAEDNAWVSLALDGLRGHDAWAYMRLEENKKGADVAVSPRRRQMPQTAARACRPSLLHRMQCNTRAWVDKTDNAWLASVVIAFDATMQQVACAAEVAGDANH